MTAYADLPWALRVLVVIMPRPSDMELARTAHWYRLPLAHAPPAAQAEALAFYQTAAFGAERWSVRYIAPVQQVQIVRRAALLPDEPTHPRANERYLRYDLGPLAMLPLALPSRRLRRVTFIPTTFGQLLRARDVAELWHPQEDSMIDAEVWAAGIAGRPVKR